MKNMLISREKLPLTDRTHSRNLSLAQKSELDRTLHARINSLAGLDEQLQHRLKNFQGHITNKELQTITSSMSELVSTLQAVSVSEIKGNQMQRDNNKITQEMSMLKTYNNKMQFLARGLESQQVQLKTKVHQLEMDLLAAQKQIQSLNLTNEDLQKKLRRAEQRLQALLESNTAIHREQLKLTLLDTLQENEQYKKNELQKAKDMQKLTTTNSKLLQKINRLNSRLNQNKQQTEEVHISDKIVITLSEIPHSLDFRHEFLSQEYKSFINSVLELSHDDFLAHMQSLTPEQRRFQLGFMYNHWISYRDLSYQQNELFSQLIQMQQIKDYDKLSIFISSLAGLVKVTSIKLWLRDYQTGFLRNVQNGENTKVLYLKGAFKDCLENKYAVNKLSAHKATMYQNTEGQDVQQESTYLFPIITDSYLPAAILEFYKPTTGNNTSDVQYMASIIGGSVQVMLNQMEEYQENKKAFQIKDILLENFFKLISTEDKQSFASKAQEIQLKVLQMSTCEIAFVENKKLYKYHNSEIIYTDSITGVCGEVYRTQQSAFFQNISREVHFNQIIDLYSIAPIFVYPIVHKKETLAIISLTLTGKQIQKHRFKEPMISLQQRSSEVRLFCELVATAYIQKFSKDQ